MKTLRNKMENNGLPMHSVTYKIILHS